MCNSLEERSSPLRSAALHLSTLAEIVIRSVLNAAFPRINLRPVAAFCIISQSNHVHNQILQYRSPLQSLYIFQKRVPLPITHPRFISIHLKKKEIFPPIIIYRFIVQISTKTISLFRYIHFLAFWKNCSRRLIAAPPQKDIRGFEMSTADKKI